MNLSVGIVGLPNVGKSTLFNAITNSSVSAQNYPFCTIEPSSGIVPIRDERLDKLAEISRSKEIIPAVIEFVDIAGLVKGASSGEGLGNKFLSHIREVSAILHVVRCFDDGNIIHVNGEVSPIDDIEIINTELVMADYELAEKVKNSLQKKVRGDKKLENEFLLLSRVCDALSSGTAVRDIGLAADELKMLKQYNFLTVKPVIYVANVSEDDVSSGNNYTEAVCEYAKRNNSEFAVISAKIEEELTTLSENEREEYLKGIGAESCGLDILTGKSFTLLNLQTFLTSGEKETRAWTIKKGTKAPQAAGVIHSDFERGFIRANIVSYEDFVKYNGFKGAKENGAMRQEGKDYVMRDGDVVEFLFNV